VPVAKLTVKVVEKLIAPDPSGKQVLHWDMELKGFAVLCSGTTNCQISVSVRNDGVAVASSMLSAIYLTS
jgi:hypothetical protein